jgi:16S rRNA (guanine527-N7)-methyltransferase
MAHDLATALARGLEDLRLALTSGQREKLLAYVELLGKWNRTYNLTAIREPSRMVTHHLLDSLAALPHLPPRDDLRLLDVGSGGGLPGIPLAIARPEWRVVMVEPNHKKTAFLTQAAIELDLANAAARAARVEALRDEARFDVVISRAFADLATFAAVSAQHVKEDGLLVAMKGVHPSAEIADLPPNIEVTGTPSIVVPGLDSARHLVLMKVRP